MSSPANRQRDVVPDPKPEGPQTYGLMLFGLAMRGRVKLKDPVLCRDTLNLDRRTPVGWNDLSLGRLHAIDCIQYAARHLAEACNTALNDIERATVAGPSAHAAALVSLTETLTAALDRVAPPGSA
ncbi:MAG: hypothetical protein ACRYGP_13685 [Janthinobacterium lividum]